jgi:cobyrinic acid a,c-diamide synthase
MYLAETLHVDGETYPMCGVLPIETQMPAPLQIAYVRVKTTGGLFGAGNEARGHVFHQSEIVGDPTVDCSYELETTRGERMREGFTSGNVLASYAHIHFASCPALPAAFVGRC